MDFLFEASVGERVGIEHAEERVAGLDQRPHQAAGGKEAAGVVLRAETFNQVHVGFGPAHDIAHADLLRIAAEIDAAVAAPLVLEVAKFSEMMDDLHEVMAGDAVGAGSALPG